MCVRLLRWMSLFAILIISVTPSHVYGDDGLPDRATLSANRMRFDSRTGDFLAEGDVVIVAGGLTVQAPRGTGNARRQEILFDSGIAASGDWMGDPVDIAATKLELSFVPSPTCRFQEGAKGSVGPLHVDADRVTIILAGEGRTKFWAVGARRLEDRARGLSFSARQVEGTFQGGTIQAMTAKGDVRLRGRPKAGGEAVDLRGDDALWSIERGSVVLSGNVSAVQGGRALKSSSIVYFPDQDRIEAMGSATTKDGSTIVERATIAIDLSKERGASPKESGRR